MANPSVVNVSPAPNATDVVLGESIIVTFSEPINTDSLNNATFALTGPNLSSILTPDQLTLANPQPSQGRGYILGTFAFSTVTLAAWAPFTNYAVGAVVVDSNGNMETVTTAGISGPYAPTWITLLGEYTTDSNVPAWQASDSYALNYYILDPNGNLQKATAVSGPSGLSVPTFNTVFHGITFDGGVTWTNEGPLNPVVWLNGGPGNSNQTVATFSPAQPFLAGTQYTVLIVGSDSPTASTFVEDLSGHPMLTSYQWIFTTGTLNITVPPVQNPTTSVPAGIIDLDDIQIIPRATIGNDLDSVIELIFPAPIDTNTFDPTDILVGVNAVMNDPVVMVPTGITATYVVQGAKLIVTISGA